MSRHGSVCFVVAPLWLLGACENPPTGTGPADLLVVQSPPAVGVPGLALTDTVRVQLARQSDHRPRSGVALSWVVAVGGGSVEVLDSTTDANGMAAARWTLGPRAGPNTLRVQSPDGGLLLFESIGTAFQVDHLEASADMGCGLVGATLWCWGEDFWDASLPVSHRDFFGWVPRSSPAVMDSIHQFTDFALTPWSICGLDPQHLLYCATYFDHALSQVAGLPLLRRIVAAPSNVFHCGLTLSDSTAWCWQLGHPPNPVSGSPAFTTIRMEFVDTFSACGLRTDSTAACWGAAPLGDGTLVPSSSPVAVTGGHHFAELAVGKRFACGRRADRQVWCWGRDYDVTGVQQPPILTPTLALTGALSLAAGSQWAHAMTPSGIVAWHGAGFEATSDPIGLTGLPVVQAAGNNLFCYRLVDGQVYCYDEMWDNSTVIRDNTYSAVQPVPPASHSLRRP
jgi:hypothetical protein